MKKSILPFILLTLTALPVARAEDISPSTSTVPASPSHSGLPVMGIYGGGQTGSQQGKGNVAGFMMLRQPLNEYLSLSFQFGEMYSPANRNSPTQADVRIQSYEFVPRLYLAPGWDQVKPSSWSPGICRPYIMAGAGYFHFIQSGAVGSVISSDTKGAVGGIFGGGIDYLISPNIAAGIDIAYIFLRPDQTVSTSPLTNTVNLDTLRVTVGVRFKL